MKRITFILTTILLASSLAHAQTASLDKTFGDHGATITSFPEKVAYGFESVILPDGKILQSGVVLEDDGGHEATVYRYDENGKLDMSFGIGGRVKLFSAWPMYAVRMATYPDGRILMYGYENRGGKWPFVTRILQNGIIDSTFGEYGSYHLADHTITSRFLEIALTGDNKILIVGTEGPFVGDPSITKPIFRRLTSDGRTDSTFGINGILTIPLQRDSLELDAVCKNSSEGYVFICRTLFRSHPEFVIFRTDANGSIDTTFAENGFLRLGVADGDCNASSAMVLSDNSILFNVNIQEGMTKSAIIKLTKQGELDDLFGISGAAYLSKPKIFSHGLTIDSLGRIISAGCTFVENDGAAISVFRYHSDGKLDSSFGVNGILKILPNSYGEANGIVLQKDGKYLVTGEIRSSKIGASNLICRIDPNAFSGVRNQSNNITSISLHPTPSTDNCTVTYTLPNNSTCTIKLRDESGREVRTLMTSEYRTVGKHDEELDLRGLSSGVYFLSLEYDGNVETAKLIKQ
jgi:uncharacterized delta-60 repeat protein